MMRAPVIWGWACSAALAASAAYAGEASHALRGEELYEQRCAGCHSPQANRVGPLHKGVVGRVAGTVPDYAYSPALAGARFVWTPQKLDQWLTNPEKLVPGQRMGYSVPDSQDRADLIAYLELLSVQTLSAR